MGNSPSSAHGASMLVANNVYVRTNQALYKPGDTVTGYIYINITVPTHVTFVELRVAGKESVYWEETHRRKKQMHGVEQDISVTRKHFGRNVIFKTASPVYNPQGVLAPGTQFSIPFAFVLPTHLPPSFSAEGGNTGQQWSCFIAYAVNAVCHTCDGQLPLKHSQHIHITSERSAGVHVHHPITREQTRAVTTCCCFPQGSTGLQITVDKSAYVMGEEVAVVAQVDNRNSRQRFPRSTCKVTRHLTLAATHVEETEVVLSSRCVDDDGHHGHGHRRRAHGRQGHGHLDYHSHHHHGNHHEPGVRILVDSRGFKARFAQHRGCKARGCTTGVTRETIQRRSHKKVVYETVASVTNLPGVARGSMSTAVSAICARMNIPVGIPASSGGALVCCAYFVNWTLHSGAFSFTNNVRGSIGIPIFDTSAALPEIPMMMPPPADAGAAASAPQMQWAPEELPNAQLQVPSAPPIPDDMLLPCEYADDEGEGGAPPPRGAAQRYQVGDATQPLLG
ncbi:hypothetical protein PPROV_000058200 [Pycnococcus provasolii]|uniref:Arrestin-like N-terminal domain-containing protein n=1 Tax=Pycnococcus provasolii TaxID=41880 RepID=A0A830H463_9CHLO|nr:hypothetical protein PPROV_000058200 [Pycnococcus provasolii]